MLIAMKPFAEIWLNQPTPFPAKKRNEQNAQESLVPIDGQLEIVVHPANSCIDIRIHSQRQNEPIAVFMLK